MRQCLLTPIPEIDFSADLLGKAADALLSGNVGLAASLVAQADIPEIMAYAVRIVGKMSIEVHRQVKLPKVLQAQDRGDIRMPTEAVQKSVFDRDGWRCRFCESKVISKKARTVLTRTFPSETRWSGPEFNRHAALYALGASLDHIVPHSRGGTNEISNFVTACYCCQFGRGNLMLDEVELEDPRTRAPIVGKWDGLTRIEKLLAGAT